MNRALLRYVARRVAFLLPQLFIVSIIAFALLKLTPGDPARLALGPAATNEVSVQAMRERLGLDDPVVVQYVKYITNVVQADWGRSFRTQEPILEDIGRRLPATLELITLATLISLLLGASIGIVAGLRPRSILNRFLTWYGFFAGSIPDFWMGLLLIFFFFHLAGIAPAPLGQISISTAASPEKTYLVPIDALIDGNWAAFESAITHLVLPTLTLVLVYMPAVLKTVSAAVEKYRSEPFLVAARVHGMRRRYVYWYLFRNTLPPTITIVGVLFVFLIGGTVLVEKVFAWNGFGQYAVEAVLRKDLLAVQGFLLVAAAFTMLTYLIVDILYAVADPRVRL